MTTKTKVIGVRVDGATDARLAKFERETGVARWMAEVLMFTKPKK